MRAFRRCLASEKEGYPSCLHSMGYNGNPSALNAAQWQPFSLIVADVCHPRSLCPQQDRWAAVLRGVFAGNIFDLGCAATTSLYHEVRGSYRRGSSWRLLLALCRCCPHRPAAAAAAAAAWAAQCPCACRVAGHIELPAMRCPCLTATLAWLPPFHLSALCRRVCLSTPPATSCCRALGQ